MFLEFEDLYDDDDLQWNTGLLVNVCNVVYSSIHRIILVYEILSKYQNYRFCFTITVSKEKFCSLCGIVLYYTAYYVENFTVNIDWKMASMVYIRCTDGSYALLNWTVLKLHIECLTTSKFVLNNEQKNLVPTAVKNL